MIMDFNVNVKFDATPALVGAVATLATAISGCTVMAPQVINPLPAKALDQTPAAPQAEQLKPEAVAQATDAPAQAVPETTASERSDTIADTVVREAVAVQAKAGKKTEIKALLAEFGVKSSPELPQERRAEFIQKINAL